MTRGRRNFQFCRLCDCNSIPSFSCAAAAARGRRATTICHISTTILYICHIAAYLQVGSSHLPICFRATAAATAAAAAAAASAAAACETASGIAGTLHRGKLPVIRYYRTPHFKSDGHIYVNLVQNTANCIMRQWTLLIPALLATCQAALALQACHTGSGPSSCGQAERDSVSNRACLVTGISGARHV